ncbi:MAG: hypothetical protein AAGF07_01865 [Patescibacteria group bacterium]
MNKSKKTERNKNLNKRLIFLSTVLSIFVVSLGMFNYINNQSYLDNRARASEDFSTEPINPGGGDLALPTAPSQNSNDSSASNSTTVTTSEPTSPTSSNPEAPTNKAPGDLPSGESDVLIIDQDNRVESQTPSSQENTNVQQPTSQPNINTGDTVRSGGLEFTLASLALIGFAVYLYYYRKKIHSKSKLKTAEKKIASK